MSAGWRVAVATVLLALGAVVLLVPGAEPVERDWFVGWYPEDPELESAARRRWAIGRTEAALAEALDRVDARERARAARRGASPGLSFRMDPAIPAPLRSEIERAARDEIAAAGHGAPRHPVVVVAAMADDSRTSRYMRWVVLPEEAADPCVVLFRFSPASIATERLAVTDRALGTCAFYAAFGTPGSRMSAWLRSTGLRSAGFLLPPAAIADDTARIAISRTTSGSTSLGLRACAVGRAAACRGLFSPERDRLRSLRWDALSWSPPPIVETDEVAAFSSTILSSEFSRVTYGLLSAMATAVGPAQFESVWRSAQPPDEAFQAQMGEPIEAWLQRHVAARIEPYHAGAMPPASRVLAVIALIAAASAAGIGWAPRRVS